jgi:MFS superfamily sulfate permease-like transporter
MVGNNLSTDPQSRGRIPFADLLFSYQKEWLRPDVIAGLTAAAVVIPKAMAYATIAGLPVQVGLYTAFLPMVIYALLGTSRIHLPRGSFIQHLLAIFGGLSRTSTATLALGLVMIALLVGIERFFPRVPAPLIAVALAIVGTALLGWQIHGVELIGHVPKGLPSFIRPDFSLAPRLWPGALGIALMSFTETIAAGRAFARAEDPPVRANQEMLATGLANVCGALSGALAVGGGTTQTAVNRLAGARTQLSELITAGAAMFTLLFLSPVIALMPEAALAAVVIVYSIGMIKPAEFRAILKIRKMEFIWAIAALAGVLLLGTLKGLSSPL